MASMHFDLDLNGKPLCNVRGNAQLTPEAAQVTCSRCKTDLRRPTVPMLVKLVGSSHALHRVFAMEHLSARGKPGGYDAGELLRLKSMRVGVEHQRRVLAAHERELAVVEGLAVSLGIDLAPQPAPSAPPLAGGEVAEAEAMASAETALGDETLSEIAERERLS